LTILCLEDRGTWPHLAKHTDRQGSIDVGILDDQYSI